MGKANAFINFSYIGKIVIDTCRSVANFSCFDLDQSIFPLRPIMSVYLVTISYFQLLIYFLTSVNSSNIRYNSLLSAQCKARCLSDYRNSSQYHRALSSMKMKRYLASIVNTFLSLFAN